MSDGTPDSWTEADHAALEADTAALGGVRIFTYALGSGADASVTDAIAMRNGGLSQVCCGPPPAALRPTHPQTGQLNRG
jgi:hypothetical protein